MSEEIKPYSEIQEAKVEKVKSEIIAILTTRITTTALVLIPSFIFSFKNNPHPDDHHLFHLAYYGCYLNILLLFLFLVLLIFMFNLFWLNCRSRIYNTFFGSFRYIFNSYMFFRI